MLKKLKSPVVWITIIAQVSLIIALFNETLSNEFKVFATSIVEVLTLFGILNNPDSRSGF